jgi:hypothetical protein
VPVLSVQPRIDSESGAGTIYIINHGFSRCPAASVSQQISYGSGRRARISAGNDGDGAITLFTKIPETRIYWDEALLRNCSE